MIRRQVMFFAYLFLVHLSDQSKQWLIIRYSSGLSSDTSCLVWRTSGHRPVTSSPFTLQAESPLLCAKYQIRLCILHFHLHITSKQKKSKGRLIIVADIQKKEFLDTFETLKFQNYQKMTSYKKGESRYQESPSPMGFRQLNKLHSPI